MDAPAPGHSGGLTSRDPQIAELEQVRRELEAVRRELAASQDAAELEAQRLRFLAEAGEILGATLDYETTLKELGQLVVPMFADWYSADLVDEDGVTNIAVAHVDPTKVELAHELRRRFPPSLEDETGIVQVVRTGRSEWYGEIPDALLEEATDDPDLLKILRDLGLRSAITAPLVARGRPFGALTLVTAESGRRYEEADVTFAEELGKRAGLAIENARLVTAERAAAERISLVARATALLADSLDYEAGLERLAQLVAEDLADFCLIDILDDDGTIRRVASIHRDPEKQHVAEGLRGRPPDPSGSVPGAIAMRTRAIVRQDVNEDSMRALAEDPDHLELIRQIGGLNYIAVPLIARDRVLGAMTVSSTSRRYGAQDVDVFTELAGRAALHLDNARLYAAQTNAANQARRLQSIVDAAFTSGSLEELLEELIRRVRDALGTDLAGLLLMDEDEPILRIRAAIGLEEEVRRQVAVPVGAGFAGRVAASRRPLVVEDLSQFEVVSAYLRERVRSIVGVPLLLGDDVVGVLHTSSVTPRAFGRDDIALLELAAERAAVAIRRAELYERQQQIASLLQQSLVPGELPDIPGLEVAALFRAAGRGIEVGGDFYDVFARGDGTWGLVVGDVCGRGPEAAAVTALVRNGIRVLAMDEPSPAAVFSGINRTILRSSGDRFCTAVYATVEPREGGAHVTLSRAGHPAPLVVRADGSVRELRPSGSLLGVFADARCAEEQTVLGAGDALVAFTDGLVERNPRLAGEAALAELLASCAGLSAVAIVQRIAQETVDSSSGGYRDDVVVLAVRVPA